MSLSNRLNYQFLNKLILEKHIKAHEKTILHSYIFTCVYVPASDYDLCM